MPGDGSNWHSVYMSIEVLLVECKGCNHRAAIDKEHSKLKLHQGNMETIAGTKFRCTRCGYTAFRAYIPTTQERVHMFVVGDPVGTMRQVAF